MSEHDTEFCAHIGADRPTLKLLMKCRDDIALHWFDVGKALLREEHYYSYLNKIQHDYSNDVQRCCFEMLHYWLTVDAEASWNKLIDALQLIHLNGIAERVKQDIIGKGN